MEWWQAILLGVVQGITEFLPISSDGHLVLVSRLLNLQETPITFDIFLHFGTLIVMVVYFRKQLLALKMPDWINLGIATVPAVVLGVGIRSSLDALQQSPYVVAASFFMTAFFVWLADALWQPDRKPTAFSGLNKFVETVEAWQRKLRQPDRVVVTPWQALCVGLFQALAILPGLSRSGSTLLGGAVVGLKREDAFPFAFMVGVPAIFGAVMYDLVSVILDGEFGQQQWGMYLIGVVAAGISGWLALSLLAKVMKTARLHWFAAYCLVVSVLSLFIV
jgi:undecaprenyl-diphosphatase